MIITVEKKVRPGRKCKDAVPEYVDIDMLQIALMKLHDMSKAEIARHFDVNPAKLAAAIVANRNSMPWKTLEEVVPTKIGRPKKVIEELEELYSDDEIDE